MYTIQKQSLPNNYLIWDPQLTPENEIITFETEAEAQAEVDELNSAYVDGMLYRVTLI
jgi:hypothetical protein